MPRLAAALEAFPVVAVIGARQTGKSTLVRDLVPTGDRLYVTLDDIDTLSEAEKAPEQLLRRAARMTIDEVQRSPDLLLAIKRAVDEDRQPGRFVLTGSANLLLMSRVSESLAGRAAYLTLWPLTRREQLGAGASGDWDRFFDVEVRGWRDLALASAAAPEDWKRLAKRGGYPVPAHELKGDERRDLWFDGYVRTYLERDLQQLSAIEHLADDQGSAAAPWLCHRHCDRFARISLVAIDSGGSKRARERPDSCVYRRLRFWILELVVRNLRDQVGLHIDLHETHRGRSLCRGGRNRLCAHSVR